MLFDAKFERKNNNFFIIIYITIICLWLIIIKLFNIPTIPMTIVSILLSIVLSLSLYKGNLLAKIVFSVLYITILILVECLVAFIFMILNIDIESNMLIGSIICIITCLCVIFIQGYYRNKNTSTEYIQKYSWIILITPLSSLLLLLLLFILSIHKIGNKIDSELELSMILVALLIIVNIIMLKVYNLLVESLVTNARQSRFLQQLELKKEHNEEIEIMLTNNRKINHNIKNHNITLKGFLADNRVEEAIQYLEDAINEDKVHNVISKTGNIPIDTIVNSKYLKSLKSNIDFKVDINIPMNISIKGVDLSILLGNVLDNAIEANQKEFNSEKFINLYIVYENDYLVVSCINSYNGIVIKNKKGAIQTQKEDILNHGFGLESVESICEKYNGYLEIEYTKDRFIVKSILFTIS